MRRRRCFPHCSPSTESLLRGPKRSFYPRTILLAAHLRPSGSFSVFCFSSPSLPPLVAAAHVLVVYVSLVPALPPSSSPPCYAHMYMHICLTRCQVCHGASSVRSALVVQGVLSYSGRETSVKSTRDRPSERQAGSQRTHIKCGYAQNCTIFPEGNRTPASPASRKKLHPHIFSRGKDGVVPLTAPPIRLLLARDSRRLERAVGLRCTSLAGRRTLRGSVARRTRTCTASQRKRSMNSYAEAAPSSVRSACNAESAETGRATSSAQPSAAVRLSAPVCSP